MASRITSSLNGERVVSTGWRLGGGVAMVLVARAHQAKLQCTGDGRGREGQGVDVGLDGFELVFDRHTELLLFVNDQQAEVFELNALSDERVCPDQNVDLSILQFLEGFGEFFAGLEAVDVVHGDRKITRAA